MTHLSVCSAPSLTDFLFLPSSPPRPELAFSPNSNEVHIQRREGKAGGWMEESVLSQHDLRVSSIDWASKSNRIVTCSADRNAYVWNLVDGVWRPTLVLLRINRAATCVRWSPNEDKFAVGSGAKLISVCYFEEQNDWWVSKHVKKQIKSTITCLDWHPNNVILACGSTDYKVRIFSAFVKEVDGKEPAASAWGGKVSSGGMIAEFSAASGQFRRNCFPKYFSHLCRMRQQGAGFTTSPFLWTAIDSRGSDTTAAYPSLMLSAIRASQLCGHVTCPVCLWSGHRRKASSRL